MATTSPAPSYPTIPPLVFVRSDSDPKLFYTVSTGDDRCACGQHLSGIYHCSCPDHVNRARDCKHVKRVLGVPVAPRRSFTVAEVNRDLYGR